MTRLVIGGRWFSIPTDGRADLELAGENLVQVQIWHANYDIMHNLQTSCEIPETKLYINYTEKLPNETTF